MEDLLFGGKNVLEAKTKNFTQGDFADIDIAGDSDEKLVRKIDARIKEASPLHKKICKEAEENVKMFRAKAEELSGSEIGKYNSKAVLSKIFLTVRNLVGLSTDNPAHVEIIPDSDNIKSIKKARSIETLVEWRQVATSFQEKLTMALFGAWVKRDSFLYWFWNYDDDDIDCEVVNIEDLTISPEETDIQKAEYCIYHPYRNRAWWKKNYPKKYDSIKFVSREKEDGEILASENETRGNVAQHIAYWENDILVEMVRSKKDSEYGGNYIILKKVKNPYFEWRESKEQAMEIAEKRDPQFAELAKKAKIDPTEEELIAVAPELAEFEPIRNYFLEPRKPFVQIPSIKMPWELYSENIAQHAKGVFISMNEKKRAFADNLRGCNQKIVVDADVYSKEEADKLQTNRIRFSGRLLAKIRNRYILKKVERCHGHFMKILRTMRDIWMICMDIMRFLEEPVRPKHWGKIR